MGIKRRKELDEKILKGEITFGEGVTEVFFFFFFFSFLCLNSKSINTIK